MFTTYHSQWDDTQYSASSALCPSPAILGSTTYQTEGILQTKEEKGLVLKTEIVCNLVKKCHLITRFLETYYGNGIANGN